MVADLTDFGIEEIEKEAAELTKLLAEEIPPPEAPPERPPGITVADLAKEFDYTEAHVRRLINEHCPGAKAEGGRFEWDRESRALVVVRQTLGTIKRAGSKMSPKLSSGTTVVDKGNPEREPAVSLPAQPPMSPPGPNHTVTVWMSAETFEKLRQDRNVKIRTGDDVCLECVVLSGSRIIREELQF